MTEYEKAFDFCLPDCGGSLVTLSKEVKKFRFILLSFYRGGWCPVCSKGLKNLSRKYDEIQAMNIEVLGISHDHMDAAQLTRKKKKIKFRLLLDENIEAIKGFNVLVKNRDFLAKIKHKFEFAIPSLFLIDTDMNVVWKHICEDSIWRRMSAKKIVTKLKEFSTQADKIRVEKNVD